MTPSDVESAESCAERIRDCCSDRGPQVTLEQIIESDRAAVRAEARREALEEARRIVGDAMNYYGSAAEGCNEPEFSQALACESAMSAVLRQLDARLATPANGGRDGDG